MKKFNKYLVIMIMGAAIIIALMITVFINQDSKITTADTSATNEESYVPVLLESNTFEDSKIEFEPDPDLKASKPYRTLQDCINSEKIKNQIDTVNKLDNKNSVPLDTSIEIEDETKLVLKRTFAEELKYPGSFIKTLETTVISEQKTFTELAKVLDDAVETQNITLVVRYYDKNGKLIFEREFDDKGVVQSSKESSADNPDNS